MPTLLKTIESSAFYGTNLSEVILPDGFEKIGNYAFYNCYSLTSITIPASTTSIGEYSFWLDAPPDEVEKEDGVINTFIGGINKNLVIKTTPGSYAEEYARAHDITVIYIDEGTTDITLKIPDKRYANMEISLIDKDTGQCKL